MIATIKARIRGYILRKARAIVQRDVREQLAAVSRKRRDSFYKTSMGTYERQAYGAAVIEHEKLVRNIHNLIPVTY